MQVFAKVFQFNFLWFFKLFKIFLFRKTSGGSYVAVCCADLYNMNETIFYENSYSQQFDMIYLYYEMKENSRVLILKFVYEVYHAEKYNCLKYGENI